MQDLNEWMLEAGVQVSDEVAELFEQWLPTLEDKDKVALAAEFFDHSVR